MSLEGAFKEGFTQRWVELEKKAGVYEDHIQPLVQKYGPLAQQAWQGTKDLGQKALQFGTEGANYLDKQYMDFLAKQIGVGEHLRCPACGGGHTMSQHNLEGA